ncbi:MAG: tetratricopeptide repeat protein [Calditrichia bacterium]
MSIRPLKLIAPLLLIFAASLLPLKAQYNAESYFNYLESTFNADQKDLRDYLIADLTHFLDLYPENEYAGRAQYMLATTYKKHGKKHEALASYLKMILVYPQTRAVVANTADLQKLVTKEKGYKEHREMLTELTNKSYSDLESAEAYSMYLETLDKISNKDLSVWIQNANRKFIRQFPDTEKTGQSLLWLGNAYRVQEKHKEANAAYSKFGTLFPDSELASDVYFKQGEVLYKKLDKPAQAVEAFSKVVDQSKDSTLAGNALFMRAEVKEKKRKAYEGAIEDYKKVTRSYDKIGKSLEARWRSAILYTEKAKNHEASVQMFNELLNEHKGDKRGIEALEKMAEVYKDKMKEYAKSAETLARIGELYPEYDKAPERMLQAGELCEEKLKNYSLAIMYYEKIISSFPDSKKAKDARKKIEKARKKSN